MTGRGLASPPVIVVGNISVGGTGKTPLTAWLVGELQAAGWSPGIVSRGHGGEHARSADASSCLRVTPDSEVMQVGDEPLMLARATGAPMAICRRRALAVAALAESGEVDVIVADDGLQHYAMARDIELLVVDGVRGFGNGFCLPAGPLREPASRLADFPRVVVQLPPDALSDPAASLHPSIASLRNRAGPIAAFALETGNLRQLGLAAHAEPVHALAGIGDPERFFTALESQGLTVIRHPFPDHHGYTPADLPTDDTRPILVTSKDAVKLHALDLDKALRERILEVPVTLVASAGLLRLREDLLHALALPAKPSASTKIQP